MQVIGNRLLLRPLVQTDASDLVALINKSANELREFMPWLEGKITLEEEEAFLNRATQEINLNVACHFAIVRKDEQQMIGVIGTHPIDWLNETASIGYWISTEYAGKGLMTEATLLMMEGLYIEMNLHRIAVSAAIDNIASNRVIEKVGFRFEGVQIEAGKVSASRWKDLNCYALLSKEYKSIRNRLIQNYLLGSYPKIKLQPIRA